MSYAMNSKCFELPPETELSTPEGKIKKHTIITYGTIVGIVHKMYLHSTGWVGIDLYPNNQRITPYNSGSIKFVEGGGFYPYKIITKKELLAMVDLPLTTNEIFARLREQRNQNL